MTRLLRYHFYMPFRKRLTVIVLWAGHLPEELQQSLR